MYTIDHILPVIPIKHLVNQDGETTTPHKLALAHFRILNDDLLNNDLDVVPEQALRIILDIKSAICMSNNGKDTKHTRHINTRMNSSRNGK